MHALLSTPAFLSSVSGALLGAEGARRMACVSRCWRANIRTEHPQRHEEDDDAAEAFRAAIRASLCSSDSPSSPPPNPPATTSYVPFPPIRSH